MQFITISQYLNKLHSVVLGLLIVPLLGFIALYLFANGRPALPGREYLVVILLVTLMDWLAAMILFDKKIKLVRKEQGLGVKLNKYFQLTIVRYGMLSVGSMALALGFFLWRSEVLTAFYLAGLILSGILWPTGRRISRHLRLKGDEREMVYFQRDNLA